MIYTIVDDEVIVWKDVGLVFCVCFLAKHLYEIFSVNVQCFIDQSIKGDMTSKANAMSSKYSTPVS